MTFEDVRTEVEELELVFGTQVAMHYCLCQTWQWARIGHEENTELYFDQFKELKKKREGARGWQREA